MKKIIQFFQSPLFLPVAIVFALYLYGFLTIPMSVHLLTGLRLLAIYSAGTILVRLSEKDWKYSLVIFLILLPISIYIAVSEILYYMWIATGVGIHSRMIGWIIAIVLLVIHAAITFQSKVRLNKTAVMALLLFILTLPFFVFNFRYFVVYYLTTEIIEKVQFGNHTYYILDENNFDSGDLSIFYKCSKWRFTCEALSGSYKGSGGGFNATIGWKIIIDDQKKEVSLFDETTSGLIYTDGENPRAYTGIGGILHDHLYSLSQKCNNPSTAGGYHDCESYTFIPYKCNMKSVLCNSIPIRYTIKDYFGRQFHWFGNDPQNEISLYDEHNILIFTYGAHPRCYVDGCEILRPRLR